MLRCEIAVAIAVDAPGQPRAARSLTWPGWPGWLEARQVDAGGVSEQRLAALRPVARGGGERFQRTPGSTPRSLKKAFQAQGVPAWARAAPLFYDGDALVFVPGLGIDARARAAEGAPHAASAAQAAGAPG